MRCVSCLQFVVVSFDGLSTFPGQRRRFLSGKNLCRQVGVLCILGKFQGPIDRKLSSETALDSFRIGCRNGDFWERTQIAHKDTPWEEQCLRQARRRRCNAPSARKAAKAKKQRRKQRSQGQKAS